MIHRIDLDMATKVLRARNGLLLTDSSLIEELNRYDLMASVIEEFGPGGGNALVRLEGTYEDIRSYLREVYCAYDPPEAQHYVSHIRLAPHEGLTLVPSHIRSERIPVLQGEVQGERPIA